MISYFLNDFSELAQPIKLIVMSESVRFLSQSMWISSFRISSCRWAKSKGWLPHYPGIWGRSRDSLKFTNDYIIQRDESGYSRISSFPFVECRWRREEIDVFVAFFPSFLDQSSLVSSYPCIEHGTTGSGLCEDIKPAVAWAGYRRLYTTREHSHVFFDPSG